MSEYEPTAQDKLKDVVEPNLRVFYKEKYTLEQTIVCQQVVDDLRPAPLDEDGKPLTRSGKPVLLGDSDRMKELTVALRERLAQIAALEKEAAKLKREIEAAQPQGEPSLTVVPNGKR